MIRPFLIGMVAGMRSMTPLAAMSIAKRRGLLPCDNGAPGLIGTRFLSKASMVLAVAEWVGDKIPSSPDRIIVPGIAARVVSAALAGAAMAPRRHRSTAAIVGATAAVLGAYLSFAVRARAIRRFGQSRTGLVEDVIAVGGTLWLLKRARPK
jgi:uncharacterized membrane protein